jgi:hypothetical protein
MDKLLLRRTDHRLYNTPGREAELTKKELLLCVPV